MLIHSLGARAKKTGSAGSRGLLLTVEGILEAEGRLRLLEPIDVSGPRRVMVTFLDKGTLDERICPAILSEPALARDWEKPQEVAAWSHLSQLPSL